MSKGFVATGILVSLCAFSSAGTVAEDNGIKHAVPIFQEDGSVRVPAFTLPLSPYLSPEARAQLKLRTLAAGAGAMEQSDITKRREAVERSMAPLVSLMQSTYPVKFSETVIGGVPVRMFIPESGVVDHDRVLINIHGSGFSVCAEACSMLESIPIAHLGGFKVVAVDYRMAPEAKHPAAVDDVVSVYQELLKSYEPTHIGIYGCSAGGAITAQSAARLYSSELPQAGALGILGAGAVPFSVGDSAYLSAYIEGGFPAPDEVGGSLNELSNAYFEGVDEAAPDAWPGLYPDIIKNFPPTLLVTASRAMDMTPAIVTNAALLKAGVDSTLLVAEGLGHCYMYSPQLPESHDAYELIVKFFREHLR